MSKVKHKMREKREAVDNLSTEAINDPQAYIKRDDMIAKAAYYKAEKRGFAPGYEKQDWLEAEAEINESTFTN